MIDCLFRLEYYKNKKGDAFMTKSLTINKTVIRTKTLYIVAAVFAAVALPQIFHFIGAASGLGSELGAAFLPMHLPVLLAGLIAGPVVGLIAGMLSPLASYALSGMPSAVMLPNMIAELAGYGLAAGLLYNSKMPIFGKLIIVQIAGRLLKAAIILLSVYALGSKAVAVPMIWNSIVTGLPGILLQWAMIPLFMFWFDNRKKKHE